MPFGAMRHGFTYQAAVAPPVSGTIAEYTSLGKTILQSQYTDIGYAGLDSSNRPVFISAWEDNSGTVNNGWIQMFRVNSDATVTAGTAYQLDSGNRVYAPSINTELDGGGYQTNSSSSHAYIGWTVYSGTLKAVAVEYDVNAMTMTIGTILNTGESFTGAPSLAYIGNNKAVFGQRGGNNGSYFQTRILTRTGTTLSTTGATSLFYYGGTGGYETLGYPGGNLWIQGSQGNNADGIPIAAFYEDGIGTYYESSQAFLISTTESTNAIGPAMSYLNNSNQFIASYGTNQGTVATGTYLHAGTVTWGLSTPTISLGTRVQATSDFVQHTVMGDPDGGGGILAIKNLSNVMQYRKFTTSGNTVTFDGAFVDMPSTVQTASNWIFVSPKRSVKVGTDKYYVMGVRDQSSSPVRDFKIVVLKNP